MTDSMIYVDRFGEGNSNYYWLDSFKKFVPRVLNLQMELGADEILRNILSIEPNYIHFGGSVKREFLFPIKYLEKIRDKLEKVRITYFYGDGYYFSYQREIVKYIDKLLISHRPSDLRECNNVEYVPCPTNLEVPKLRRSKIYEVSFIGNNYSKERMWDLKKISEVCDLVVFGRGWENTELKCGGVLRYEDFPEIVAKSLFCLGGTLETPCEWAGDRTCELNESIELETKLCCDESCVNYRSKYGYFSNRVMNLCASRACILLHYSDGLEEIFCSDKNIIFFKDLNDLKVKVEFYKNQINLLEEIGENAHFLSREYTFDKLVKRLIGE